MSEPQGDNPQYSRRGWKITGIGLFLTFNYILLLPILPILTSFHDNFGYFYWSLFMTAIGTPIAFVGSLLSIKDKWGVGKKNIWNEIFVLLALIGNAFFWASIGTVGV